MEKQFTTKQSKKPHLTLKDYQQAFAKYWNQGKVKAAPKAENEVRDENYEKFKRWEWYWESRVTPKTEAFPKTTAWDVFKQYMANQPKAIQQKAIGNWVSVGPDKTPGGYAGLGRVNCVAFSPVDTNTFMLEPLPVVSGRLLISVVTGLLWGILTCHWVLPILWLKTTVTRILFISERETKTTGIRTPLVF